MSDQWVLAVEETRRLLRLSRAATYEGIRSGQIPAIRIGWRLLVPRAALEKLLDRGAELDGNRRREGSHGD